jgi:hypothetical protein
MGNSEYVLSVSSLRRILGDWPNYNYKPVPKKKVMCYCDTKWLKYALDAKKWPPTWSLNFHINLHLELFCQKSGSWDEIP